MRRKGLITRRSFLRGSAGLFFLPSLISLIPRAMADPLTPSHERKRGSIAGLFKGEELAYEIGFWVFKQAALGKMSFKEAEKKGQYIATLETETMGILGFVSRYRVDAYRSIMEEIEGGSRLRALSFDEDVKVGNTVRKNSHQFDYQRRKWVRTRVRKGGVVQKVEEDIPPGKVYDDFLTASYNFRYGVYGAIERGKTYTVPTFPRKGATHYELKVALREEEEKKRRSEGMKDQKEFFVKLILDPDITHSKEGRIEGWLSKELLPVEGILKDAILFGDVKGTLIKSSRT